jgi:DNA modification methylase
MNLYHGDCVDVMAGMDPESVDAVVCDPPYGLEFMGKEWDRLKPGVRTDRGGSVAPGRSRRDDSKLAPVAYGGAPRRSTYTCDGCGKRDKFKNPHGCAVGWSSLRLPDDIAAYARAMQAWHQQWAEAAYRVAKPSAYLLAFGGTRTVHRMTVALEDAGWVIRDMLVWGYASGFPKSKASLKPAWEPIVMARKPGPLRMLAIDECRIGTIEDTQETWNAKGAGGKAGANGHAGQFSQGMKDAYARGDIPVPAGRWPANIVLTDPIFDGGIEGVVGGGETGVSKGGNSTQIDVGSGRYNWNNGTRETTPDGMDPGYGDSGTYSRFFLIPKAARSDREPVLGGLPVVERQGESAWAGECNVCGSRMMLNGKPTCGHGHRPARANVHPTVKPTDLMRHLVRLVTPTGGTVLDPFLGSGTTGLAAEMEGFDWIGIEREAEYVAIAEARLNGTQRGLGLDIA